MIVSISFEGSISNRPGDFNAGLDGLEHPVCSRLSAANGSGIAGVGGAFSELDFARLRGVAERVRHTLGEVAVEFLPPRRREWKQVPGDGPFYHNRGEKFRRVSGAAIGSRARPVGALAPSGAACLLTRATNQ